MIQICRKCSGSAELAVLDAGAGAHALHLAGSDHRVGTKAVLMLECSPKDVGGDVHAGGTRRPE